MKRNVFMTELTTHLAWKPQAPTAHSGAKVWSLKLAKDATLNSLFSVTGWGTNEGWENA